MELFDLLVAIISAFWSGMFVGYTLLKIYLKHLAKESALGYIYLYLNKKGDLVYTALNPRLFKENQKNA